MKQEVGVPGPCGRGQEFNDVVCLTFCMDINVYAVSFTQPMILLREKCRNWFYKWTLNIYFIYISFFLYIFYSHYFEHNTGFGFNCQYLKHVRAWDVTTWLSHINLVSSPDWIFHTHQSKVVWVNSSPCSQAFPPSSLWSYCKQSKIGQWEGVGMMKGNLLQQTLLPKPQATWLKLER